MRLQNFLSLTGTYRTQFFSCRFSRRKIEEFRRFFITFLHTFIFARITCALVTCSGNSSFWKNVSHYSFSICPILLFDHYRINFYSHSPIFSPIALTDQTSSCGKTWSPVFGIVLLNGDRFLEVLVSYLKETHRERASQEEEDDDGHHDGGRRLCSSGLESEFQTVQIRGYVQLRGRWRVQRVQLGPQCRVRGSGEAERSEAVEGVQKEPDETISWVSTVSTFSTNEFLHLHAHTYTRDVFTFFFYLQDCFFVCPSIFFHLCDVALLNVNSCRYSNLAQG